MIVTMILVGALFVLTYAYFRGKYNQNYWKKRGVAFYEKHKSGGPFWEYAIGNTSVTEILRNIYDDNINEPAVGLGSFFNKALFVKDLTNLQHIYQSDFQSFYHRGFPIMENDLLANNILFLDGPKWKLVRQKFTPLFTVSKLKNMHYIIDKSSQDFVTFLKQNPDKLRGDAYDTISHFSSAAIAAAVFGINTKSTFDSPFRTMAKNAFSPTLTFNTKFVIGGLSDELYKALGLRLFADHEQFFINALKQVIRQREREGVKRHDFVDMCVKLQKEGTMVDPETGLTLEPSDELLAAQAFFFFIAGVDTSSGAMFATIMELGRHPHILQRVHEEVDAIFEKYNDQLNYDAIQEVDYLAKVYNECLRLHTPIGLLTRQCMKDTVLPVGNIPVDKGVKILLPIFSLHHDPRYFPNPEVFDPDRFSRGREINEMAYIPFGKGNRYCIGARFAKLQAFTGLLHLLRHYTPKTHVGHGGIRYKREQTQVKLENVDVEFISRQIVKV